MCGRYTITITLEELLLRYYIDPDFNINYTPRYNVAPGQLIPAIVNDGQRNRIGHLSWGLIPSWAKTQQNPTINARAETLLEKPTFKVPFLKKRCLLPADSFYEWKKTGSGKQPMRIMLKSEALFSFAGIYDTWVSPDGQKRSGCAIVTTAPNPLVAGIHNRMPLLLKPEDEMTWLDRGLQDPNVLSSLLQPFPAEAMKAYPVSPAVGNVQNDSPACIEELV